MGSTMVEENKLEWIKDHPVNFVIWVPIEKVSANDYNPNKVAKPELKLLQDSIEKDGYTQPIVCWEIDGKYEVVDGFHRFEIGKRLGLTHLPIVVVNRDRTKRNDRISSTIRHNRARGKHQIMPMSDIVIELSRNKWKDEKIAEELGMDMDEVLRLKQVSGLTEMFSEEDFSEAWENESE